MNEEEIKKKEEGKRKKEKRGLGGESYGYLRRRRRGKIKKG